MEGRRLKFSLHLYRYDAPGGTEDQKEGAASVSSGATCGGCEAGPLGVAVVEGINRTL